MKVRGSKTRFFCLLGPMVILLLRYFFFGISSDEIITYFIALILLGIPISLISIKDIEINDNRVIVRNYFGRKKVRTSGLENIVFSKRVVSFHFKGEEQIIMNKHDIDLRDMEKLRVFIKEV